MDLRQLRYFVRIVELKNLARAAKELRVAQSALSWHLRNLEREVNVNLVTRHSRGIEPTAAGLLLQERAVEIMQRLDDTKRQIGALGQRGQTRIMLGATPPMQRLFALVLAKQCGVDLPQASLMVVDGSSAQLVEEVRSGRIDLCLAYEVEDRQGCARRALLRDPTVLVERRKAGAAAEPTVTLKDAARRPLALPNVEHPFRRMVADRARRRGIELNVAFESSSLPVVRELIEQGSAAALLPFSAVARDVHQRRLTVRRLVEPAIVQTVWLYHAERKPLSLLELNLEKLLKRALMAEIQTARRQWLIQQPAARSANAGRRTKTQRRHAPTARIV